MERMNYIHDKSNMPASPHFAALVFECITIPGDERSRTNPGHGYPEHTESVVNYIKFADRSEMEKWVASQELSTYRRDNYIVAEIKPLTVRLQATVE